MVFYSKESEPKYLEHPKISNTGTWLLPEKLNVVELKNTIIETTHMSILMYDYFGPRSKTVGIINGKENGALVQNGIRMFKRKKQIITVPIIPFKVRQDQNYFHFIVQQMPATLLAIKHCHVSQMSPHILRPMILSSFEEEFLNLVDIPKIKATKNYIYANKIVLPRVGDLSMLNKESLVLIKEWQEEVKNLEPRKIKNMSQRIFISRKGNSRYGEIDAQVEAFMNRQGFLIVEPNQMSFVDQIKLFSDCKILVSSHGAGMANMIFMPPGGKVLELNTFGFTNLLIKSLSQMCSHEYIFIDTIDLGIEKTLDNLISKLRNY
jgi:capsular polysaccharide biosynthesis protein